MSNYAGQRGQGSDGRLLLAGVTQALVQEEESTIGSGRDNASSKATQSEVVHLHPTRIPDNSGAAARRIRSGLAFTVSSEGGGHASWLI